MTKKYDYIQPGDDYLYSGAFHLEYGVEAGVRILQSGSQSIVMVSVGMRPVGDCDII